ncbi:hypothetical protein MT418_000101 [Batrachochytrium dendrobatidis]
MLIENCDSFSIQMLKTGILSRSRTSSNSAPPKSQPDTMTFIENTSLNNTSLAVSDRFDNADTSKIMDTATSTDNTSLKSATPDTSLKSPKEQSTLSDTVVSKPFFNSSENGQPTDLLTSAQASPIFILDSPNSDQQDTPNTMSKPTANSFRSISTPSSTHSEISSKSMPVRQKPTSSSIGTMAYSNGSKSPGIKQPYKPRSISYAHEYRPSEFIDDMPPPSAFISEIESLHAFHGTSSLGSVPIEPKYPYMSRESESSEFKDAGLTKDRSFVFKKPASPFQSSSSSLPNPKTKTSTESPESLDTSHKSWFAYNPTSYLTTPTTPAIPETESTMFLISPDSVTVDMPSMKRNADMHEIFPEMESDELLIEDYSCAWQKDLLLHGRLYITTKGLAFNAKIIWSYSNIIPYSDIISMEKKNVVGIIPSAIEVSTTTTKHFFATFLTRDTTLELATRIWMGYPNNIIRSKLPNNEMRSSDDSLAQTEDLVLSDLPQLIPRSNDGSSIHSRHSRTVSAGYVPITATSPIDFKAPSSLQLDNFDWMSPISPTSDLRFVSQISSGFQYPSRPRSYSQSLPPTISPLYGSDKNVSSASLLLSKNIGLAELVTFDTNSVDNQSVAESIEQFTSDLISDTSLQPVSHRAHIVHQKHPVVFKSDTPRPLKRIAPHPSMSSLKSKMISDSKPLSLETPLEKDTHQTRTVPESTQPVDCSCDPIHAKMKPLLDTNVPLPLETVWVLLYGFKSATTGFLHNFWITECKHRNLKGVDWVAESVVLDDPKDFEEKTDEIGFDGVTLGSHKKVEYVIPLTNPLGPKETRCRIHDQIVQKTDLMVCIRSVNTTPDVPSGTAFEAITRICLTFVSPNITRMRASCDIEYSKSTWIKMAIDRAIPEGLKAYQISLLTALRLHITKNPDLVKLQSRHSASTANDIQVEDSTVSNDRVSCQSPARQTVSTNATHDANTGAVDTRPLALQQNPKNTQGFTQVSSVHLLIVLVFMLCIAMANLTVLWRLLNEVSLLRGEVSRMGDVIIRQDKILQHSHTLQSSIDRSKLVFMEDKT